MPKKGKQIEVKCETCGEPKIIPEWVYRQSKHKRFYCGVPCKLKGTERKVKTKCSYCGDDLEIHKSQFARGKNHFCSNECKWEFSYKTVEKNCDYCNKPIKVQEFRIRNNKLHFCDAECRGKFDTKRIDSKCKNCGADLKIHPCKDRDYVNHFCDKDCYFEYAVGENSHTWKGGLSFLPYPPDFNAKLKRIVRKRDSDKCQLCGKNGKVIRLCIHHSDYDKNNNEFLIEIDSLEKLKMNNLITLCSICHGKTNHNREIWQRWFNSSSSFWFAARSQ